MTVARLADGAEVVRIARSWIGTPYRHQASLKGVGADCLGLVRGVWRELFGGEPEAPPPYSRDWGEARRDEALWRAATRRLAPDGGPEQAGDVILFRMFDGAPAKHLAIVGAPGVGADEPGARGLRGGTIIHAYSGRSVLETPFIDSWRRRAVAAFRFPDKD